ncbi:hypothetical protein CsSME_00001245 [Camellia sinensis var. sinensis]
MNDGSLLVGEILEKLYGPDHIAIGNELVKLSSIQLSLGDQSAMDCLNRVAVIFSRYYGSHANTIFPYLQGLEREAHKLMLILDGISDPNMVATENGKTNDSRN